MSEQQEENTENYRKYFRNSVIPKGYRPYLHVSFNFGVLVGACLLSLSMISSVTLYDLLIIPIMFILGNLAVFFIHRYPLHKNLFLIHRHTYDIHTKQHHRFYTDQHIVYERPQDFYILFFPTWTILAFAAIFLPLVYLMTSFFLSPSQSWLIIFCATGYFLLYETLHYISHLPPENSLLKIKPLRSMWKHHRVHHDPKLMHKYNFNIVYPLADWLFGTWYSKD